MDKNTLTPQNEVLDTIKQSISASEERRRLLRLDHNLNNFAQGNVQVLKSDEFIQGLVDFLFNEDSERKDLKRKLLISLGEAATHADIQVRERTLTILSLIGEHCLLTNETGEILLVADGLCKWLEHETEMLAGMAVVIKRMEELTLWLLDNAFWNESANIVALFHSIRCGEKSKGPALRKTISHTLEKFATQENLELVTNGYLKGGDNQALFRSILIHLEIKAAKYLLNRIVESQNKSDRLTMLPLLPAFGIDALPILEKFLHSGTPWDVIRNILSILSEIGSGSCYSFIKHYFHHEDKRVQYQMICCIMKLGGPEKNSRLLDGLNLVSSELKILVIQILVESSAGDEKVFTGLCNYIEKENYFLSYSHNQLAGAIIVALKSFPCIKCIEILRKFSDVYQHVPGKEKLLFQIDEALKFLTPKIRHRSQRLDEGSETISYDNDPEKQQKAFTRLAEIEEKVRQLLRDGDMSEVNSFLHEQAINAARSKDYFLAEKLRDRLLEINPMALAEAITLGDLIEEEKNTSHVSHHLGVWSELYEEMTTDEFNALYSILRLEEYIKNDTIVRSGETDDVLYFLSSGYVSLNCLSGGNVRFLKRMGPGSILGGDHFFSASVWTVTLQALTEVQLQVLDHLHFVEITKSFPGIEEKLRHYCNRFTNVTELLKMSGDERREYPRFAVPLVTQSMLLDPYGNKGKRMFKGELKDISLNGLAFIVKFSSRNNAKMMLGRQIVSALLVPDGSILAECTGVVVGVRYKDDAAKDSTVHVKLAQQLENKALSKIITLRRE